MTSSERTNITESQKLNENSLKPNNSKSTVHSEKRTSSPKKNSTETSKTDKFSNQNFNSNNDITNSSTKSPQQELPDKKEECLDKGKNVDLHKAVQDPRQEPKNNTSELPSKKKFTLSLSFASHRSTITSLIGSVLPQQSEQDAQRTLIKNKLRKTSSISTLEEEILFQEEKGSGDVRKKALKKTFELESLKRSFNTIRAFQHKKTPDGYDYQRLNSIWDELEGDILIMGGYRGSVLRDKNSGRQVWLPIKAGFNLRKVDLRIGSEDDDELQTMQDIYPDGILSHIGPVDICRHLIKKIKSNPKIRLTNFGYDWRLSPDIPAKQLADKLQEIYDSQDVKKGTYVIAHSMGGMIAHKALQEKTNLIRGIIYVGSPSKCPNILGPLKYGDEVLMNKTILSKEANFFMRSSFVFLPEDGRCFVQKDSIKRINLDFFDPEVWIKLGISPLVDENRVLDSSTTAKTSREQHNENEKKKPTTDIKNESPTPRISTERNTLSPTITPGQHPKASLESPEKEPKERPSMEKKKSLKQLNPLTLMSRLSMSVYDTAKFTDRRELQEQDDNDMLFNTTHDKSVEYLKRTLNRTKNFLSTLQYIPDKQYPPLVIVYSKKLPTVRGAHIQSLKDVKLGNYSDYCYGPGDGVVYHKWLLPEHRGFPIAAKIETDCGHVSLMSDTDAIAKAFISLVDNDKHNDENQNEKQ